MKKTRILQYSILLICAIVFTVCCILLVRALIEYSEADRFYNDITLSNGIETDDPDTDMIGDEVPKSVIALMESYRALKAQYPNVIGYIRIDEVGISYPVVQGADNEYYTKHLITGEENNSGSIFLDFRLDTNPEISQNFILYGHNMNDRSMFHNIRDLFDEENFKNAKVEYICDDGVFLFDSLAIYMTNTSDLYHAYGFTDDGAFASFFADRAAQSRIAVDYAEASNLITLVTCSNLATDPDSRFIYHGKMIKAYTDMEKSHE